MPIRHRTSVKNQGTNHSDGAEPNRLMAMAR